MLDFPQELLKRKNSKLFNKLSIKLIELIKDLYLLQDEKTFVVGKLKEITKEDENCGFSEMIYESDKNKNLHCISIEDVDSFVKKWKSEEHKQEYKNYFVSLYPINKISLNDNNISSDIELDFDFSDSEESESDDIEDDNINQMPFLLEKDKITYLNFDGLNQYLGMLKDEHLISPQIRLNVIKLYNNITKGLISCLKDRYNQLIRCQDNSFKVLTTNDL